MIGEHQVGLRKLFPKFYHYSILIFLMDLPIISKIDTYHSQCDHLNTENTTVLELP